MEEYGSVYARYRSGDMNKKYAIGFVVRYSDWDLYNYGKYNSDQIMDNIDITFGRFANILEQIKNYFDSDFNQAKASKDVRAIREAMLKETSEKCPRRESILKPTMLVDFIEQVTKDYETGKRFKKRTSKNISLESIKDFRTITSKLKQFQLDCSQVFSIDDVDTEFLSELTHWFVDQGLKHNTIHDYMGSLRFCMKIAYKENFTKNRIYKAKGLVPPRQDIDEIYLTKEQIDELYSFDLSDRAKIIAEVGKLKMNEAELFFYERRLRPKHRNIYEQARDLFVVGCLTGQRFSDYSRISSGMIMESKGISFIRLTQNKTLKTVLIPVDKRVKAILDKYNGKLPKMSMRHLNTLTRYIAELLGWTWEPTFDNNRLGYKRGVRFCDMISSHTCRRSFATNAYAAGVPIKSIIAVTGHSREDSLRTYLKLQRREKGIMAANSFDNLIEIVKQ